MKEIWFCFANADVIKMWIPLGNHISTVANMYVNANVYWMRCPLDTPVKDAQVIRYIPN